MARIKILLPETFKYKTTIPVRITDLNYGNHLANDKLLSILHEARVQFLTHYGYTELNCGGVSLIMADVAIEYKNEAFFGDQLIISIIASEFTRISFDIYYLVETRERIIAKAKTGIVTFDYNNRKVVEVPKIIKNTLG